ncbi:FGGY family carbohydrate kinase, partial [Pantoea sp. SIMBA_133]
MIGIDLGTSAVKVIAADQKGQICAESSRSYPLYNPKFGYSEQDPEDWVNETITALQDLMSQLPSSTVEGISFSGQMHGLVLLDAKNQPLRRAILWNDTRSTKQCRAIEQRVGEE